MKRITTKLININNKTSSKGNVYELIETEDEIGSDNYYCWNTLLIPKGLINGEEVVIIYDQKGHFKSVKAMRKVTDKELPIETMVKQDGNKKSSSGKTGGRLE